LVRGITVTGVRRGLLDWHTTLAIQFAELAGSLHGSVGGEEFGILFLRKTEKSRLCGDAGRFHIIIVDPVSSCS
jgi:hypothetical protein